MNDNCAQAQRIESIKAGTLAALCLSFAFILDFLLQVGKRERGKGKRSSKISFTLNLRPDNPQERKKHFCK